MGKSINDFNGNINTKNTSFFVGYWYAPKRSHKNLDTKIDAILFIKNCGIDHLLLHTENFERITTSFSKTFLSSIINGQNMPSLDGQISKFGKILSTTYGKKQA